MRHKGIRLNHAARQGILHAGVVIHQTKGCIALGVQIPLPGEGKIGARDRIGRSAALEEICREEEDFQIVALVRRNTDYGSLRFQDEIEG